MIICIRCNTRINAGAQFCGNCGKKIDDENFQYIKNNSVIEYIVAASRKNRISNTVFSIGVILYTLTLTLGLFPSDSISSVIWLLVFPGMMIFMGIVAKRHGMRVVNPGWLTLIIPLTFVLVYLGSISGLPFDMEEIKNLDVGSAIIASVLSWLTFLPVNLLLVHYISRFIRASSESPASKELFWWILGAMIVSDGSTSIIDYSRLVAGTENEFTGDITTTAFYVYLPLVLFILNTSVFYTRKDYLIRGGSNTYIVNAINKKHLQYELKKRNIFPDVIAKKLKKYEPSSQNTLIEATKLEEKMIVVDSRKKIYNVSYICEFESNLMILLKNNEGYIWILENKNSKISIKN